MKKVFWLFLVVAFVAGVGLLFACDGKDCGKCCGDKEKCDKCDGKCKGNCKCDSDEDGCDKDDGDKNECDKEEPKGNKKDDECKKDEGREPPKIDEKKRKEIIAVVRKIRALIVQLRELKAKGEKGENKGKIEAIENEIRELVRWLRKNGIDWWSLKKRERCELDPDVKKLLEELDKIHDETKNCDPAKDKAKLGKLRKKMEEIWGELKKKHNVWPEDLEEDSEKKDGDREKGESREEGKEGGIRPPLPGGEGKSEGGEKPEGGDKPPACGPGGGHGGGPGPGGHGGGMGPGPRGK